MGREPLSAEAREFIAVHIRSVRQLELLLLLREERDEPWTAERVATALRVAPAWAAHELGSMRAAALLHVDENGAVPSYAYAPSADDEASIAELADAYRRRKPTVIQAVLTAMGSDVQALSDAFRLRGPQDG